MSDLLHFSLCIFAFNCFALAKFNHYRDVFNTCPTARNSKRFILLAWITILLSLMLCISKNQGYGALLFCGYMSVSILFLMIFYSFKASWIKIIGIINVGVIMFSGLYLYAF